MHCESYQSVWKCCHRSSSSNCSCIFIPPCTAGSEYPPRLRPLSCRIYVQNDQGSIIQTFQSLLAHAEELISARRVREARRLITQFIDRKPLDPSSLPTLAALYLRVGKPEQAIGTMRLAIEQLGMTPELLNSFGLILASLGRERESRQQFEEALRIDPTYAEALRNMALTLHRAGERSRAYLMLARCYHAAPLSTELRLICGALLESDGRLDEAACCYHDVMEISQMADQVELASQRLFAIGGDRPTLNFEDMIAALERSATDGDDTQAATG